MGDMRNIVVVPYNLRWPELFQREADLIRAIFGQELISIHHIGSTAIPGIDAKPVIDIMPVVRDIERVEAFDPALAELGYVGRGENGIPGRRYFVKGGDEKRSHHVHAYEPSNPEMTRHLDFRDYLIAHPEESRRYVSLKIELAAKFPHDIWGYMEGKDTFIKETIEQAHEWSQQMRRKSRDNIIQQNFGEIGSSSQSDGYGLLGYRRTLLGRGDAPRLGGSGRCRVD